MDTAVFVRWADFFTFADDFMDAFEDDFMDAPLPPTKASRLPFTAAAVFGAPATRGVPAGFDAALEGGFRVSSFLEATALEATTRMALEALRADQVEGILPT